MKAFAQNNQNRSRNQGVARAQSGRFAAVVIRVFGFGALCPVAAAQNPSPAAPPDLSDVRLQDIPAPPVPAAPVSIWPWVAGAVAALVVLGLAFWWWRRRVARRRSLALPDPWSEAIERLEALTQQAGEPGFAEAYAQTLRRFIARTLGVPAMAWTVSELDRRLAEHPLAARARGRAARDLAALLAELETAHYGGDAIERSKALAWIERARSRIEKARQEEEQEAEQGEAPVLRERRQEVVRV